MRIDKIQFVRQTCLVSHTITVRLSKDLAEWLQRTSERTGLAQGKIIRHQLETALRGQAEKSFMRLAGIIRGPRDLSTRKGFSFR